MLPKKVLSLDFQDGLSLFFHANFVLNQHYMELKLIIFILQNLHPIILYFILEIKEIIKG